MKKKMILRILCTMFITGCTAASKVVEPNGATEYYAHVSMVVDETDPYACTGIMDYVFAGTVREVLSNYIDPHDRKDKGYSYYAIHVEENLKGSLQDEIEAHKKGGVDRNGVTQLLFSDRKQDTGLPEAGKTYIFMAYGQQDGSLLLSEFFDNRECSDALIAEYNEYIEHEIPFERTRFPSQYEKEKEVLKIGHWLDETVYGPENEPVFVNVSCSAEGLEETSWKDLSMEKIPEEIHDQILHDYPEFDPDGWQMMVHYYNEEQSDGILQLRYQIGKKIITDRAVSAHISGNRITAMYYTDMEGDADEQELLSKVREFEDRYEQGKYILGEGETFLNETYTYSWYYGSQKLIYTYNLFFEEASGVINNSIGCEYELN